MDIGAVASSSSRLLDALEKSGLSQGEGLVSTGPSPVPDKLAREFERLLEDPAPSREAEATGNIRLSEEAGTGQTGAVQPPEQPGLSADKGEDLEPAGNIAGDTRTGEGWSLSPAELYSLQFQVAMLRLTAESGSQVQRQASQGLDSLLRSQS